MERDLLSIQIIELLMSWHPAGIDTHMVGSHGYLIPSPCYLDPTTSEKVKGGLQPTPDKTSALNGVKERWS